MSKRSENARKSADSSNSPWGLGQGQHSDQGTEVESSGVCKTDLDYGVICGSQSPQVFKEECDLHPGLVKMREYHSRKCSCGEEDCFRTFIQYHLVKRLGASLKDVEGLATKSNYIEGDEAFESLYTEFLVGLTQSPLRLSFGR